MSKIKVLVLSGILASLIAIVTSVIKIPLGIGYIHLGDGVIFFASYLLPFPLSLISVVIGVSLADALAGYFIYIPISILIKGLISLLFKMKFLKSNLLNFSIIFVLVTIINCGLYFAYEIIIYKDIPLSTINILYNFLQTSVGMLIFLLLLPFYNNIKKQITLSSPPSVSDNIKE